SRPAASLRRTGSCAGSVVVLLAGDGKPERAPLAGLRLDPDAPAVALDDLLHDREPDARAGVIRLVVQPLEHHEDAIAVLRVQADAVVLHGEEPHLVARLGADVDP